jgi:hypothetical protein
MTPAEVAEQLALFVSPTQVTELRALHVGERGRTFSGWFLGTHLHEMARQALSLSRQAAGVYFIPNPIDPAIAAKRLNAALNVPRGFALTTDSDILERRYLIVDLDPRRGPNDQGEHCPSAWRELGYALVYARLHIRTYCVAHGFPDAVTMCSGNGVHLVYPLRPALPGGKCGSADPLAGFLRLLSDRFSDARLSIDPNTFNSCRMLKVPGTTTRKGEATPNRPYRTARITEIPNGWLAPEPVAYPERPAVVAGDPVVPAERTERPQPKRDVDAKPAKRAATKPRAVYNPALFDAGSQEAPRH